MKQTNKQTNKQKKKTKKQKKKQTKNKKTKKTKKTNIHTEEGRPLKTSADFSDDMGKWKMDGEEIINEKGYLLDIRSDVLIINSIIPKLLSYIYK